jgi:hypothetical protein
MNQVVDEIRKAASLLDAGATPATISGGARPATVFAAETTKVAGGEGTKPLVSLTIKEVETLFVTLSLGAYKSIVAASALDGATLVHCSCVEDFVSMGVTLRPKAALLLANVDKFKAAGVPLVLLDPTALVNAAKEGSIEAICVCLNNNANIEIKDEVCMLLLLCNFLHLTIILGVWPNGTYLGLCKWSCRNYQTLIWKWSQY